MGKAWLIPGDGPIDKPAVDISCSNAEFVTIWFWKKVFAFLGSDQIFSSNDSDIFSTLSTLSWEYLPLTKKALDELAEAEAKACQEKEAKCGDDEFIALYMEHKSLPSVRGAIQSNCSNYPIVQIIRKDFEKIPDVTIDTDVAVTRRLKFLQTDLVLNQAELDAILAAYFARMNNSFLGCLKFSTADGKVTYPSRTFTIFKVLGYSEPDEVYEDLKKSCLAKGGILNIDGDSISIPSEIFQYLDGSGDDHLISHYVDSPEISKLSFKDFSQIPEEQRTLAKKLLNATKSAGGTNILFYGAPGTGKTAFASVLARECNKTYYALKHTPDVKFRRIESEVDSVNDFRFRGYRLADIFLRNENALILIDEADHLLNSMDDIQGRSGSVLDMKSKLVGAFDQSPLSVIWIINCHPSHIHPAVLRRFDYSIEFPPLNKKQREKIWVSCMEEVGVELDEATVTKFAEKYAITPGVITTALKNAKRLEDTSLVEVFVKQFCTLTDGGIASDKMCPAKDYSLDGLKLKTSVPLDKLIKATSNFLAKDFVGVDKPRMNILLSGPPGTGKTEFVKYLASQLDKEVVVVMGSDLLGMYVGQTEQNIAQAFRRAEETESILFLDEIDGMLRSRGMSEHSWEVTQVNELLHQMENFNGIMIGATNFSDNLDPAVVRRFTYKVEFDYLDDAGKVLFFERMLGRRLNGKQKEKLCVIPKLTPGDFRTVRQSFFYLGEDATVNDLIEALAEESRAKKEKGGDDSPKVGFLND